MHTHLLHNLHSIHEREHDALLSRTEKVGFVVGEEVHTVDRAVDLLVLQHTLRSVAKGDDRHTFSSDRGFGCDIVHLGIAYALGGDGALAPRIENARAVDAEQHAQTGGLVAVVDVGKRVDTALDIIVHLAKHTIDHS